MSPISEIWHIYLCSYNLLLKRMIEMDIQRFIASNCQLIVSNPRFSYSMYQEMMSQHINLFIYSREGLNKALTCRFLLHHCEDIIIFSRPQ